MTGIKPNYFNQFRGMDAQRHSMPSNSMYEEMQSPIGMHPVQTNIVPPHKYQEYHYDNSKDMYLAAQLEKMEMKIMSKLK